MQGSLGEKIGGGAYSDAYAWAPGQVVKLFKPGLPRGMAWFEARMIRAVRAAARRRRAFHAGAADPAHRGGPACGELNRTDKVWRSNRPVGQKPDYFRSSSASRSSRWICARTISK